MVRVVVVNYNGGDLTLACLRSVLRTEWPPERLDVVMVDNGSTDGVSAAVAAELPAVRIVDAGANLGFAGGCNLALADMDGVDHVALLNNDATVDPGWLAPLVDALTADPTVGAACPKILFADRFVDVGLSSGTTVRGRGDGRPLGVQLSGARLDGRDAWGRIQLVTGFWGLEHGGRGDGPFEWTDGAALLRVPAGEGGALPTCELRLSSAASHVATARSGSARTDIEVGPEPRWYPVALGGEPFDVVNNVGSVLLPDGHGADRGYLQPDGGGYDRGEEVFAWCGAAVLLSRRYLEAVGLLEDRFFLYYEDFDLSWRGRAQGWRYLYVPSSVVRHVHSASSGEGSRLFQHYDGRNRLLTLTRNAPPALAVREVARHLLVTGSYARRDVLAPLAARRLPISTETVRRRLHAYGAYLRLVPEALAARRRLARRGRLTAEELSRWAAPMDGPPVSG
ncbi:MAG: glycosyltransferase family 2 protein [Actinomycetota bacterium]|nr:glycosyltransferase family 2 protein [Actinomycetota bacterium]